MNSINIIWEAPEPVVRPRRKNGLSEDLRAMLMANPGEWMCFQNVPASRAKDWKKAHEGFKFTTRTQGRGYAKNRCDLYVAYVGDAK